MLGLRSDLCSFFLNQVPSSILRTRSSPIPNPPVPFPPGSSPLFFPRAAILGRIPGTTIYRSTLQYPEATTPSGVLIWRIDAPIYFANARYLKAQALRLVDEHVADEEEGGVRSHRLQFLILDLGPVLNVDVSAALILGELHRDLGKRGVQVSGRVRLSSIPTLLLLVFFTVSDPLSDGRLVCNGLPSIRMLL